MSRLWQSVVSGWTWLVLVLCLVLWLPLMLGVLLLTGPFDRGRYIVGYLFRQVARVTVTLNPFWR
ncbi:MAG: 1-acyl-sn-glycerol-3-phosphate acyltransferase, partial [Gemmatimonadales bacterium]|nr:1-acyl-sn-glycerol-3-phosphate acyltransferase [Gemmatimonadales bacterium]